MILHSGLSKGRKEAEGELCLQILRAGIGGGAGNRDNFVARAMKRHNSPAGDYFHDAVDKFKKLKLVTVESNRITATDAGIEFAKDWRDAHRVEEALFKLLVHQMRKQKISLDPELINRENKSLVKALRCDEKSLELVMQRVRKQLIEESQERL